MDASSTVVIFASGERCDPTEAVPSTTRSGGLHGVCWIVEGVIVSCWDNVCARDLKGVRVISVASVPFETVDRLDPND